MGSGERMGHREHGAVAAVQWGDGLCWVARAQGLPPPDPVSSKARPVAAWGPLGFFSLVGSTGGPHAHVPEVGAALAAPTQSRGRGLCPRPSPGTTGGPAGAVLRRPAGRRSSPAARAQKLRLPAGQRPEQTPEHGRPRPVSWQGAQQGNHHF